MNLPHAVSQGCVGGDWAVRLHAEERERPAEGSSRPPQRTSLLFYIADEKVCVCKVYMLVWAKTDVAPTL